MTPRTLRGRRIRRARSERRHQKYLAETARWNAMHGDMVKRAAAEVRAANPKQITLVSEDGSILGHTDVRIEDCDTGGPP